MRLSYPQDCFRVIGQAEGHLPVHLTASRAVGRHTERARVIRCMLGLVRDMIGKLLGFGVFFVCFLFFYFVLFCFLLVLVLLCLFFVCLFVFPDIIKQVCIFPFRCRDVTYYDTFPAFFIMMMIIVNIVIKGWIFGSVGYMLSNLPSS